MTNRVMKWMWIGAVVCALGWIGLGPRTAQAQQCSPSEATYPPGTPELSLLISHNTLRNRSLWVKNSAKHVLSEYLTPGMCPISNGSNGPSCSPGTSHCSSDQVCASGYHTWATCPEDAGPIEQDDRPLNGSFEDPEEGPSMANDSEDTGEQGPCYCWADQESQASCSTGADCGTFQRCVDGKCRCRNFDWSGCDKIRFGLTVFDEDSCQANTDESTNHMVAEMEEEEVGRGADVIEELDKINNTDMGAGTYCKDPASASYRPLDEALLEHQRDEKFPPDPQVEERMWDRAHVNLLYIEDLPQTAPNQPDDRVSKSLDAVCKMLEGDNGSGPGTVPALVTYVTHFSDSSAGCNIGEDPSDVFAGMLAAAGATGRCCYDANADGDCDDDSDKSYEDIGEPAAFCSHVRAAGESQLRGRIDPTNQSAGNYICDFRTATEQNGSVPYCSKPDLDCQLAGSDNIGGTNCTNRVGDTDVLADISCIRAVPRGKTFEEVNYKICDSGADSNNCTPLTEDDVIFMDPDRRVFRIKQRVTVDGVSVCSGEFDGSVQVDPCPNEGQLCTTPNGCTAGIIKCVDDEEVCVAPDEPIDVPEVCDGKDNDCDDIIDEDVVERCDTGNPGRCSVGLRTCTNGSFGACEQQTRAVPEICNGLDDDCNGVTDDIRASLQKEWPTSRSDLEEKYRDPLCGAQDRCVCRDPDDPDSEYRSSIEAGDLDAEFDEMVRQTDTGCFCESD